MTHNEFLALKAEVDRMTVDREQGKFPAASIQWYDWQQRILAARQHSSSKASHQKYWDWILKRIQDEERIADFGCGDGGFARLAIESGKTFVLGVDFSPTAIKRAKQLNPAYADCFQCKDLRKMDTLSSTGYDAAVFTEVLEHVDDDLAILRAVPGGRRILLSVPSFSARGHCRWFDSLTTAEQRYTKLLRVKRSEALPLRNVGHWWLIDGVRR